MLIDMNTGPVEMFPNTRQTVWNSDDDRWYDSWVSPSGVRLYRPSLAYKQEDGSWAIHVVDEYAGTLWYAPVEVDEPEPEPTPVIGGSIAAMFPNDAAKINKAANFVKSPRKMKTALLYREEVHGHWYESGWMYFYWMLTALCAFIWFAVMGASTSIIDENPSDMEYFIGYFGWMFVGWMPLAASLIGALQKEGYKRLAAAYSVALFALIATFFHSQLKNSENNG